MKLVIRYCVTSELPLYPPGPSATLVQSPAMTLNAFHGVTHETCKEHWTNRRHPVVAAAGCGADGSLHTDGTAACRLAGVSYGGGGECFSVTRGGASLVR